jgi:uncharacterized ion transporter superfamily protein YfcC
MKNKAYNQRMNPEEFTMIMSLMPFVNIPQNVSYVVAVPIYDNIIEQLTNLCDEQEIRISIKYPHLINGNGLFTECFPN